MVSLKVFTNGCEISKRREGCQLSRALEFREAWFAHCEGVLERYAMHMTEPARCLHCGYVLWGLPAGRCPECGADFDPDDPATYSSKPLFVRWKFWLPGFLLATGSGFVLYVLLIWLS